jgi:hypothetical protein
MNWIVRVVSRKSVEEVSHLLGYLQFDFSAVLFTIRLHLFDVITSI